MEFIYKCLILIVIVGISSSGISADAVNIVELTSGWSLTNQNSTITKTKLKIPSGVYSALYGEDVLLSYNDVNMRWIAYDNWTYSRTFSVDLDGLKNVGHVNLTFHGIDTIAEIRLNGVVLGRTDNMFVRYSYDIKKQLKEENEIEVEIMSPVWAAAARWDELEAINKTVLPACPPERYNGECHVNLLRKMQASFGWDWGLAAPSMGIWKTVTLEYYEVAIMRNVDVVIIKNTTHWNMQIQVYMDACGQKDFYAELKFYAVELIDSLIIINDYKTTPISYKAPVIKFEYAVPDAKVVPWWPNGYGEQKLYPLHFTLSAWSNEDGAHLRRKTVSQQSLRIGFRTIELVEDLAPRGDGNTFLFKINGEEIFMKGTNYIPSHILPELGSDEARIKHLLMSAKQSNMNMIRVWGGGIYESDYFYDMADYYGLLIWQDMMFACAMYPAQNEFLESVREEVVQNAKRISHHASVAIFATNNENEVALAQDWYNTFHEKARYEDEYRQLYLGTVMHELKMFDHSSRPRPLVSSPSNGKESAKDNYLSDDPQNPNYGDVHFYSSFVSDGWDVNIFPRPRFASEYGFQSLPKMTSWNRVIGKDDDLIKLVSHRQHHPMSMYIITLLVTRHLPLPLPESADYPEALIYLSQISQAMGTKIETELYRTLRDTDYRTMGALYWQLNDVWIAPSWSSIDFYGNYKLLHYWAKDFFAPIAITALYNSNAKTLNISLICDYLDMRTDDLTVTQNIYSWSELYPKASTTWPVTMKVNGVHYDKVIPLDEIFNETFTKETSFVEYTLQRNTTILARNFYFPTSFKLIKGVMDPEIDWEILYTYCDPKSAIPKNIFSLTVLVRRPAIFVYIEIVKKELLKYNLSRNGFMQVTPAQMVHLEFESEECISLKRSDIKILTVNQYMV